METLDTPESIFGLSLIGLIFFCIIMHALIRSASRSAAILAELQEANRLKRLELQAKGIATDPGEKQTP